MEVGHKAVEGVVHPDEKAPVGIAQDVHDAAVDQHPLEASGVGGAEGEAFLEGGVFLKNPLSRPEVVIPLPFVGHPVPEIFSRMETAGNLRKGQKALEASRIGLDVVVHEPDPVGPFQIGPLEPLVESPRSPGVLVHPENEGRDSAQELWPGHELLDGGRVLFGKAVDQSPFEKKGRRPVGRGVVDQNQSIEGTALAGEAPEAFKE